jgi:hypothetical protein
MGALVSAGGRSFCTLGQPRWEPKRGRIQNTRRGPQRCPRLQQARAKRRPRKVQEVHLAMGYQALSSSRTKNRKDHPRCQLPGSSTPSEFFGTSPLRGKD